MQITENPNIPDYTQVRYVNELEIKIKNTNKKL